MAEEQNKDLTLPQQDAGLAFRAEMWASNAVLGYWRHLAVLVVAVLVGALIYGVYTNEMRDRQRGATDQIAEAMARLPEDANPLELTDEQEAEIKSIADDLAKIAAGTSGTASAEGWLKAAELYRILGEREQQLAAFQAAGKTARGVLLYAARSGEANLDLEDGKGDEAVAILADLMDDDDGLLAEMAALDLGAAYEFLERPADAQAVYTQFLTRWPESPRAELVQERMARLETGS